MNKGELVDKIADEVGEAKATVSKVLDSLLDNIQKTLKKGEKVQLTGFGTFERRHRKARVGRNPQTGEEVKIKASNVPAFKAGKKLKDAVK